MSIRQHQLSILEAVETLSNIADLDYDQEIGVVQKHEIVILNERLSYKTVNWLHQINSPLTINNVCEIFRLVVYYLKVFYKGECNSLTDQSSVEGIKAIMVLVEEAAKTLDKYIKVFLPHKENQSSVKEFKEYKQLQEFYLLKIARKKDEGNLSKWILSLSLHKSTFSDKNLSPNSFDNLPAHLKKHTKNFINLENIKIDSTYELIQIRKQDGQRFFNSRLLRNVKIICDLESYFKIKKQTSIAPFNYWYDHIAHATAKHLIKDLGKQIDIFLKELRDVKNNELVKALNNALMALMFSAQNKNLLHHQPAKSCAVYFQDFLAFLRNALDTDLYKKWTLYPPSKTNQIAGDLLKLIHHLCSLLYTNTAGWEEIPESMSLLINQSKKTILKNHEEDFQFSNYWEELNYNYEVIKTLVNQYPNGSLIKLIKLIDGNQLNVFDPLHQFNIPQQLYSLYDQDQQITLIRMPTPTYQHAIHFAIITEEFKAFIKYCAQSTPNKKHLIINLQDRTSQNEFARCTALEELQYQSECLGKLCVVTLDRNTDFYYQLASYSKEEKAFKFFESFKHHLNDKNSGYYFPTEISNNELNQFTLTAFDAIHRVFFESQENLNRKQRLDFIEIFHLLLEIKLLEWTHAQAFSLMCKDGIDKGSTCTTSLFLFLKLINQQEINENDWKLINSMLFMPSLLLRERVILAQPFRRMISTLQHIEGVKQKIGIDQFIQLVYKEIDHLFESTILKSEILIPHFKVHLAQNFDKSI